MNKTAIKKYAVWARRELILRVSQRAAYYEITEDGWGDPSADSVRGMVLTSSEKKQRMALIGQIRQKGYEEVMEEVAYTWFNRFSALRFMEVNGYLPSHVRVFTNDDNVFKPQILTEAINLELDGLDMEKVYGLKNGNQNEELFKYLVITQCNALNEILPGMFQRIEDYTELLFPDNLLREGSVAQQMVALIPEEDWKDQVQIIGWLYQYYNSEKKDEVFAALKKNVKITKENIPAATQLFTPDWIVRYMVENSLGRLWVEGHPDEELKAGWKYYLEEAEQEPEVQKQLEEIRKEYAALNPEDIKCIDPCMGSGHILCYMFDVLVQIYQAHGVQTRDAVRSIVENNLYGLDIDDRAAQLAYFSVMMKGRQYDSRFFKRGVQPHVYAIVESNYIDEYVVKYFCNGNKKLREAMETIIVELNDAKEYGSMLTVTPQDWNIFYIRFNEISKEISLYREAGLKMISMIHIAEILDKKYHVVVTNPPYMGSSSMAIHLLNYVQTNYPNGKADLYAAFIERCYDMISSLGIQAMITQHSWMFLSSFEKLRVELNKSTILNMIHLGAKAFEEISGEVVQTTSFVIRKIKTRRYRATYSRLVDCISQENKEKTFLKHINLYLCSQDNFEMIPGSTITYWISDSLIKAFKRGIPLGKLAFPKQGLATSDNNQFLRFWFEVNIENSFMSATTAEEGMKSGARWFPHCKGGSYRKWYGNRDYVINWKNDGVELRKFRKAVIRNSDLFFNDGYSYSDVSTGAFALRYYGHGFIFDSSGPMIFLGPLALKHFTKWDFLAFMNSKVVNYILSFLCPTIHYTQSSVAKIPVLDFILNEELAKNCYDLSKEDWDAFELSWDFKKHPLI